MMSFYDFSFLISIIMDANTEIKANRFNLIK